QGPGNIPRFSHALVKDSPEPTSKSQPNKPLPRQALETVREMIKRSFSPLGKLSLNSESERKDTPDTQKSQDGESSKPLVWRGGGEGVVFFKGTWVEQGNKIYMQERGVWPLTRDRGEGKRGCRG